MRIVAGDMRGRTFDAPSGRGTRPTSERVREATMSSLFSLRGSLNGAVVLDAFAGSGAFGFEALSRGAAHATFYEQNNTALKTLRSNVLKLKVSNDAYEILPMDFISNPPKSLNQKFDVVFLDPPYAYSPNTVFEAVSVIAKSGGLDLGAYILYEHAKKSLREVEIAAEQFELASVKSKKFGDTCVSIFKY